MDIFAHMYYLKRAILVHQFVFGTYPKLQDVIFGEVADKEDCVRAVSEATDVINQKIIAAPITDELRAILNEYDCPDIMTLVECCDFAIITHKHHGRKFFNEIENEAIVVFFIDAFERIWEVDENGPYFIQVYDWNDHKIFFADLADLESIVNNYDIAPYTAFHMKDGMAVELWSE